MKTYKARPVMEEMDQVSAFVEAELEQYDVPVRIMMQMNIAVDEIFSNIVHYSGATESEVGIGVEEETITLWFADNGCAYDPTVKADPDVTLSAGERSIGGLGIFMVKKTMDNVTYEYKDGHNILTLKKQLV